MGSGAPQQFAFEDDFSNPQLSRFYEFRPGVGKIVRQTDGLHCRIDHGIDGPPSPNDYLTIDSLGRPQPPTAQAILRFDSTQWRVEVAVEYDFATKTNGRAGYVWIVSGEPSARNERSVSFVRSADLQPESHHLSVVVHNAPEETAAKHLSNQPKRLNWFRVTRDGAAFRADWSEDGSEFVTAYEWVDPAAPEHQALVVNSSSFAGGAAFVVRSVRIFGAMPKEAPPTAPLFAAHGHDSALAEVDSQEVIEALRLGKGIHLKRCVVKGRIDLTAVGHPLFSDIIAEQCAFPHGIYASEPVLAERSVSFFGCRFASIGFSNVRFLQPFQAVGCEFKGDTRFIETEFDAGADFSLSTFDRKPFFRIARTHRCLSLYYSNFQSGADFSGLRVDQDVSLSDIHLASGTLTFSKAEIKGTTRLMATLQRDNPPAFGGAIDFTNSRLGSLVVSSGEPPRKSRRLQQVRRWSHRHDEREDKGVLA